ncbi:MAG TPA: NAD(P)/FAD-dependent oxidoreductase [Bryobacteraceae bacterium]|jgi:monoamine oxidase
MNRREVIKLGGAALAGASLPSLAKSTASRKSVVIVGAGISGLCCAYELTRRGHDVTVFEASGRPGGHVKTLHDPFADGLYADIGAEHFYYPGYTQYWRYLHEFGLTAVPYPRRDNLVRFLNGERFTEQDLQRPAILSRLGFHQPETDFLANHAWPELPFLYLGKYVDRVQDETNPFVPGLVQFDRVTVTDLLKRCGASAAAIQFFGSSEPALQLIWGAAIKKLRGTDFSTKKLFRLKGGNQLMTDAFAARLGEKVHLGCPVTAIEHGPSGTTVSYREFGQECKRDADYLVSCISLVMLRQLPVTPAWPSAKSFVIQEMPYYTRTRVVFQSRTRFWKTDGISPNWLPPDPRLNELWSIADEVNTPRGILLGGAQAGVTASQALSTFVKLYPGKSANIEQALVHDWSKEPWAGMCERIPYRLGELGRFWPEVTRPVGRIHFAGAYAAQMNWGQEAALESANRVAEEIDRA